MVLNQNKLSDFSGDGLSVMEWNTLPARPGLKRRLEFPLFHHRGHDERGRKEAESILRPTRPTNKACGIDRSAISVEISPSSNRLQISCVKKSMAVAMRKRFGFPVLSPIKGNRSFPAAAFLSYSTFLYQTKEFVRSGPHTRCPHQIFHDRTKLRRPQTKRRNGLLFRRSLSRSPFLGSSVRRLIDL